MSFLSRLGKNFYGASTPNLLLDLEGADQWALEGGCDL